MIRHIYDCQSGCPIESTLQIISGKWKSVILYHLMFEDISHFGELEMKIPGCSHRILALQLNELATDNIIQKKIITQSPLRTQYSLTEFGQTLKPVILSMANWGNFYNQKMNEKKALLDEE